VVSEQPNGSDEPGDDLLEEVHQLITALEAHPDPAVGARVTALLEGIDAVHRTALTHLLDAIRGMAGEAFINRLTGDPAIRLLLMSYELVAVDRRLLAEEALDAVRGHLHAHGIDVELTDVVGGAVYVRLHGIRGSNIPLESVRHDLEAALQDGLLGFQELVLGNRQATAAPAALVQLSGVRRPQRPVYRMALAVDELPPGKLKGIEVEGTPILLANVGGEFYAVHNRCGESPLPLEFSTLEGAELHCSWHRCRYDIRSGKRVDEPGDRLAVFPVVVEDGEIRIAVGVEPASAG
jgi:nitrite reductase/ring-hydroxylating ferredoxin subunit